jgi:hypothetical protein
VNPIEEQGAKSFALLVGAILGGILSFALLAGASGLALLALRFLMIQVRGL